MDSEPLPQIYIDQVRKRTEDATTGPWIDYLERRDQLSGESFIARGPNRLEGDLYFIGATDADIEFIAHARQDIPRLLDEIDRLKKELAPYKID
jgi:hypothetical protein